MFGVWYNLYDINIRGVFYKNFVKQLKNDNQKNHKVEYKNMKEIGGFTRENI